MGRERQAGQAAVEGVGLTVLVALLLAAVGGWLVRGVHVRDHPPALVQAVAKPLVRDPVAFEWLYPLPRPFASPRGRDGEPIGAALRTVGTGARDTAVIGYRMAVVWDRAYNDRLQERARAIVRDPIGELLSAPDPAALSPRTLLRETLVCAQDAWDYARSLRDMRPGEAALRFAEDFGGVSADVTIFAGKVVLARSIRAAGRRVVRRAGDPPLPPRGSATRTLRTHMADGGDCGLL
jgi:hypothetical protein